MGALIELGRAVHQRRVDIGLTQAALARLSGLSRTTVNQLEGGTVSDLSVTRAERLLGVVGLEFQVLAERKAAPAKARTSATELAARTASVSYKRAISGAQVAAAILSGTAPREWSAHVLTLLDEAPVSLLADVVEELHAANSLPRAIVWSRMRAMAKEMSSYRELWA